MLRKHFIILCLCVLSIVAAEARTVTTISNLPVNNRSVYSGDLNRIETDLFGRVYTSDSDVNRMSRIESRLYGQTYDNYTPSRRMNMILQDYNADNYWAKNGTTYCSVPNATGNFLTKLRNAFIGQPMGYTPPIIEPSPYINSYGPSYMRGYYGTNGWNSHNSYNPIYSTSGIHILD